MENNYNTSYIGLRSDLLKFVSGEDLNFLDIGCATGVTGGFLKEKGMARRVVGVELDPQMALEAGNRIDKLIIGNIEDDCVFKQLGEELFDFILLGDVLEHLYDPWTILEKLAGLLTGEGKIIISLPNIQHIELFIRVFIKGEWPYNKRGIFDATHLRWFTYKNVIQLEEKCNVKILKIERKFRYRDYIGSKFPFYGNVLKKVVPNLFTFQFLVVVEKWK